MRRPGLRTRLALSFALAVAAALVLFSAVVLLVLRNDEASELRSGRGGPAVDALGDDVERVLLAMALAAPVVIAAAAALGVALSRSALAPLKEASERVRAARRSALDLTLPVVGRNDEWDELARTLNELLADERGSLERIRRFTADAAHELRTPLTAILGEAEVALRRPRSAGELRQTVAVVREEAARLSQLLDALLVLARSDAGTLLPSAQPVDLDAVIHGARERSLARAGRAGTAAEIGIRTGTPVKVSGDAILLSRALENLIDNALTHGGGQAVVSVEVQNGTAAVRVTDRGPGISKAVAPAIFERFVQGDPARAGGGLGLGLAIARAIAAAHRGTLELLPSPSGATFELRLPTA